MRASDRTTVEVNTHENGEGADAQREEHEREQEREPGRCLGPESRHPVEGHRIESSRQRPQQQPVHDELAHDVDPSLVEAAVHLGGDNVPLGHEEIDGRQAGEGQEAEADEDAAVASLANE